MINDNLNANGLFVQWIQLYEIDSNLVASVLKAMSPHFSDFVAYAPDDAELLIIARKDGAVGKLNPDIFKNPAISRALGWVHVNNVQDIELRKIGDKRTLDRLIASFPIRANSDYYPVLDQNAARTRFMQTSAQELLAFSHDPLPTTEMLTKSTPAWQVTDISASPYYYKTKSAIEAMACRDYLLTGNFGPAYRNVPLEIRQDAVRIRQLFQEQGAIAQKEERMTALYGIARIIPYLRPPEMTAIWSRLETMPAFPLLSTQEQRLIRLFKAVGNRDAEKMTTAAHALLAEVGALPPEVLEYTLASGMLGHLARGNNEAALRIWHAYGYRVISSTMPEILFRLFVANSTPG
jgi:hypothetical protein